MPYYGRCGYVEMMIFNGNNLRNDDFQWQQLCSFTGNIPLYTMASYVLYATPNGIPTIIQGRVYAAGTSGQGGFHPTGVAA